MPLTAETKLRTVRFQPYRKGMGPTFTLTTWDTGRTGYGGKWVVGYRLTMQSYGSREDAIRQLNRHQDRRGIVTEVTERHIAQAMRRLGSQTVLFEGEDFGCSPLHAIDSDETVAGIMGFLTLRLGDTDAEYFESYTEAQLEYCSQHAEALACEVMHRFPEK